MKNLVIVESAAKGKTIAKYLNSSGLQSMGTFQVMASFGHITEIPIKEMGVDLDTWAATYVPIADKSQVIAKLKKAAKEADRVFLASDKDTEGEAIAWHLQHVLKLPPTTPRITFNEITQQALEHAVKHPQRIDTDAVAAQETRRILDRVVGYKLSPLLWTRFATGKLSAGRVQSAALKMLVDRSAEAKLHEPVPFWTLEGSFAGGHETLEAKAYAKDDTVIANWDKTNAVRLPKIVNKAWKQTYTATFSKKEARKNPSAPFTTSSLQQEAYSRLGLPAKRTMQLAQGLYEEGHITYMRTDSTNLAKEAQAAIVAYIHETFGADQCSPREFKTKSLNAQQAHEAIRPTHVEVKAKDIEGLTPIHKKLYDLIWRRAVASQMAPAVFSELTYVITAPMLDSLGVEMRGKHSVLIEEGYLAVYAPDQKANAAAIKAWDSLKATPVKPLTFTVKGDVSRPPALYNEPNLVKTLEKEGIGRPSTYASIIDKLFEKGYVMKGSNPQSTQHVITYHISQPSGVKEEEETLTLGGKETDRLVPTSLGERVIEYLVGVVPSLLDAQFTAKMESELDDISEGRAKKNKVLDVFYKPFSEAVEKAQEESKRIAKINKDHEKRGDCKIERPAAPKNVLRELKGADIIQTRFGPALFDPQAESFISGLLPLLQWREKTIEEVTQKDVAFLKRLPMTFEGTSRQIVMGRYGIYVKDTATEDSMNLPKDKWDDVYDGSITAKEIMALVPKPKSSATASKYKKK